VYKLRACILLKQKIHASEIAIERFKGATQGARIEQADSLLRELANDVNGGYLFNLSTKRVKEQEMARI